MDFAAVEFAGEHADYFAAVGLDLGAADGPGAKATQDLSSVWEGGGKVEVLSLEELLDLGPG